MTEAPNFNLRESAAVLGRSWRLLALFVLSAMGSALALTYVFTERYRATTTILYRPNTDVRFEGLGQQHKTFGFPVPVTQPFEALGLTIKQVGTSERILRPVVVELGLDQPEPIPPAGWARYYHLGKEAVKEFGKKSWQVLKHGRTLAEDRTTAAIEELARNITIDTKQKNYAAVLAVLDKDPVRAARIVDRLGAELVSFMREQGVQAARQQGEELDAQLDRKKSDIDRARASLEALKTAHAFIDLPEQIALHLRTAEQLELKLLTNSADLNAARAKLSAVVSQRAALAAMVKGSETIADDPVANRLRELEATLEVDLQGLLERLPKDHPDVRGAQAKVRTTKDLLAAVKPARLTQVAWELSQVYQTVQGEEVKVRAEIAGLEAAQASMTASLDQARARVPKPAVEARHNDLCLQLAVLESDYRKLATLREEVRAAELTSKAEVHLLHPATPPDKPARPIKIYHVLVSGLLALILGVAVIYLVDYGRSLLAPDNHPQGDTHA